MHLPTFPGSKSKSKPRSTLSADRWGYANVTSRKEMRPCSHPRRTPQSVTTTHVQAGAATRTLTHGKVGDDVAACDWHARAAIQDLKHARAGPYGLEQLGEVLRELMQAHVAQHVSTTTQPPPSRLVRTAAKLMPA